MYSHSSQRSMVTSGYHSAWTPAIKHALSFYLQFFAWKEATETHLGFFPFFLPFFSSWQKSRALQLAAGASPPECTCEG